MTGIERPHLRNEIVQLTSRKHIVNDEMRKRPGGLVGTAKVLGCVWKENFLLQDGHNAAAVAVVVVSHTPSTLLGLSAKDIQMDTRCERDGAGIDRLPGGGGAECGEQYSLNCAVLGISPV